MRATEHTEVVPPPPKVSLTGRAAILAVVMVILMISFAIPLRGWFDQRSDLAALREQIASDRAAIAELNHSIGRWDDDEYVRAQARDRLRFVMPGEVGYVVIGDDFAVPDPDQQVEAASTWWQRLWGSVEEADRVEVADLPAGVEPTTAPSGAFTTAPSLVPSTQPSETSTAAHLPD